MSTQTNDQIKAQDEVSFWNPVSLIGMVAGEIYDQTANLGNAFLDAPKDLVNGFQASIIDSDETRTIRNGTETPPTATVASTEQPATIDPRDAEIANLKAQLIAAQGTPSEKS